MRVAKEKVDVKMQIPGAVIRQRMDFGDWPPGHNVKVDADAEIVMFSPQHEHSRVINHMIEKVKG